MLHGILETLTREIVFAFNIHIGVLSKKFPKSTPNLCNFKYLCMKNDIDLQCVL